MKKFYKLFFAFCFASCSLDAGSLEVGTPVMEPGLNAYILENQESSFKFEFNIGFIQTNSNFYHYNLSRFFLSTGLSAYWAPFDFLDLGLTSNIGLAGKENNYFSIGPDFRFLFSRVSFLAPLYIKTSLLYASYKNSHKLTQEIIYTTNKGFAFFYGAGLLFATGTCSVISIDYARGYLLPFKMQAKLSDIINDVKDVKDGYPSLWRLVFSFGVVI